jgi:glycosyltransferase involved in cell wall biosynthesis
MVAPHSFVVLAHGESPHLEACLASLRAQTVDPGPLLVSTSTANAHTEEVCSRYGASLQVHGPNRGIGRDWNMGLRLATTPWVTLAHQDDVYAPGYAAFAQQVAREHPTDLIAFCTYRELLDDDRLRPIAPMLRVKRVLIEASFLGRSRITSRRSKRRLLRFGNPVPCPAVSINRAAAPALSFREDMRTNMDWMAWLELADLPGGFNVVRESLMRHRIHEFSETSATIAAGHRRTEDRMVFERLWPRTVARALSSIYELSYRSNEASHLDAAEVRRG